METPQHTHREGLAHPRNTAPRKPSEYSPKLVQISDRSKARMHMLVGDSDTSRPLRYRNTRTGEMSRKAESSENQWQEPFELEATVLRKKELFGSKIEKVTFLKVPQSILLQEPESTQSNNPYPIPEHENQIRVPSEWKVTHFTKWAEEIYITLEPVTQNIQNQKPITLTLVPHDSRYTFYRGQVLGGKQTSEKWDLRSHTYTIMWASRESTRLLERKEPAAAQNLFATIRERLLG